MNTDIDYTVNLKELVDATARNFKLEFFAVNRKPEGEYKFTVKGQVTSESRASVAEYVKQGSCGIQQFGEVLDDMCAKSWISPGTYLIKV